MTMEFLYWIYRALNANALLVVAPLAVLFWWKERKMERFRTELRMQESDRTSLRALLDPARHKAAENLTKGAWWLRSHMQEFMDLAKSKDFFSDRMKLSNARWGLVPDDAILTKERAIVDARKTLQNTVYNEARYLPDPAERNRFLAFARIVGNIEPALYRLRKVLMLKLRISDKEKLAKLEEDAELELSEIQEAFLQLEKAFPSLEAVCRRLVGSDCIPLSNPIELGS